MCLWTASACRTFSHVRDCPIWSTHTYGWVLQDDQQPEEEKNDDNKEMRITRLDIKSKSKMNDADLCNYFNSKLQKTEGDCGNCDCNCLKILSNRHICSTVLSYLSWFWWRPSKYECDMIIFDWYKYSSFVKKAAKRNLRCHNYCLPYIEDGTKPVPKIIHNHLVCTKWLQTILGYGRKTFVGMSREAMCSHVLTPHKATSKVNYNAIKNDPKKLEPLEMHFEILQNLGEVQAT